MLKFSVKLTMITQPLRSHSKAALGFPSDLLAAKLRPLDKVSAPKSQEFWAETLEDTETFDQAKQLFRENFIINFCKWNSSVKIILKQLCCYCCIPLANTVCIFICKYHIASLFFCLFVLFCC